MLVCWIMRGAVEVAKKLAWRPDGFYQYWKGLSGDQKMALAKDADTSYVYLSQVANGNCRAGVSICARLKGADPRITDVMLRPDLYAGGGHAAT